MISIMINSIQNFIKYRALLGELVSRDLKVKYRRSVLGYLWSLLNPLLMMIVISAVFSYIFRNNIANFPIYLLTGQIMFNFFSEATNFAMKSISGGGTLIKKVYVPKYIFPLAKVLSSFVNLLFSLLAIIIVLIITKTPITPAIFLFPLALAYILLFAIGIGLILSVLAVYFGDIVHLYSVVLTAWMYFTPIFYPIEILPKLPMFLMQFNPLYHFISYFRTIVLYGNIPTLTSNIVCLSFGLVSIAIGLFVFYKSQDNFILYI